MTPYEAAFRKKPDMRDVCKWGEKVWVCTETSSKLGGHICEGTWLGIDERFKGVHIYWPEMKPSALNKIFMWIKHQHIILRGRKIKG